MWSWITVFWFIELQKYTLLILITKIILTINNKYIKIVNANIIFLHIPLDKLCLEIPTLLEQLLCVLDNSGRAQDIEYEWQVLEKRGHIKLGYYSKLNLNLSI